MLKRYVTSALLVVAIGIGVTVSIPVTETKAASPVLNHGDRQGYVWGAQHRLKQLGLYGGHIDGIFGNLTHQAVAEFQRKYGLRIDGLIGSSTWRALRNETFTKNEIQMLAQLVHGEARGESFKGKVAVASVVLNRVNSNEFPDKVKGVIFKPDAFTAVSDGQYHMTPEEDAYRAVYTAIQGWDPSQGALYYFNPNTATSDWIWSRTQITQIGKHIFAK